MQYRPRAIRSQKMNARQNTGLILLIFTSVLPALLLTGFLPNFGVLNFGLTLWLIIAIAGGAIAGSLFMTNMKYWYAGLITGVLIGPGVLIATYYYTVFRHTILNIEIVIPMVIGALPGMLFLSIVTALYRKRVRARMAPPAGQVGQNMPVNPYQQNAFQANPYQSLPPQYPSYPQAPYQQGPYQQNPGPPNF